MKRNLKKWATPVMAAALIAVNMLSGNVVSQADIASDRAARFNSAGELVVNTEAAEFILNAGELIELVKNSLPVGADSNEATASNSLYNAAVEIFPAIEGSGVGSDISLRVYASADSVIFELEGDEDAEALVRIGDEYAETLIMDGQAKSIELGVEALRAIAEGTVDSEVMLAADLAAGEAEDIEQTVKYNYMYQNVGTGGYEYVHREDTVTFDAKMGSELNVLLDENGELRVKPKWEEIPENTKNFIRDNYPGIDENNFEDIIGISDREIENAVRSADGNEMQQLVNFSLLLDVELLESDKAVLKENGEYRRVYRKERVPYDEIFRISSNNYDVEDWYAITGWRSSNGDIIGRQGYGRIQMKESLTLTPVVAPVNGIDVNNGAINSGEEKYFYMNYVSMDDARGKVEAFENDPDRYLVVADDPRADFSEKLNGAPKGARAVPEAGYKVKKWYMEFEREYEQAVYAAPGRTGVYAKKFERGDLGNRMNRWNDVYLVEVIERDNNPDILSAPILWQP